jgi:GDPmannose 4,6-dehydratase
MARAIVLGVNGQDGSYAAEALLRRGYEVLGVGRDPSSRHVPEGPAFRYQQCDLRDPQSLAAIVDEYRPDFAFHMAAVHGASGFNYEPVWREMMTVNVLSLHVVLEAARVSNKEMRIIYGGSAKVFPAPLRGDVDELSNMAPTCLYGIGKIAARELILQYRDAHGVDATNLILFNHESPRRRAEYLFPTIARTISRARLDPSFCSTVNTLDFHVDWSSAPELMDISVDIAEKARGAEYVLASGRTYHGREAVAELFARYGLEAERHIVEKLPRSDPGPEFRVRLFRLQRDIGRVPVRGLAEIMDELVPQRPHDRLQ